MDLEEWELIHNDLHLDEEEEDHHEKSAMDNYLCPSTQKPLHHKTEHPPPGSIVAHTDLLPQVPIAWEPVSDHENKKIPNEPDPKEDLLKDSVFSPPRESFKKTKETEFADMKIDPKSKITSGNDDEKPYEYDLGEKKEEDEVKKSERLNLWRIGLNGIGSVCSFGVAAAAAATVCVFFLGHNNIKICKNKKQVLRFQVYSDGNNKRMKEVVNHATKLNEAIFAMKGVPVVRAQISFGGYYDVL
ncbi:unnamed protein product [Cochlearia groenlandica]